MADVGIECPHCKKEYELEDWRGYAKHILDKHPDDKERVHWAQTVLKDADVEAGDNPGNNPVNKLTYLGKPLKRIPPKMLAKLPKYLREQLREQGLHPAK